MVMDGGWECYPVRFDEDLAAAEQVLAGKHLVLIGDSLTRYQYTSLVYFLENGHFMSPPPDNAWKAEFESWNDYFRITNERLHGNEVCDCYRPSEQIDGSYENRYYYNPATDVRISYLQWRGARGIYLHDQILDAVVDGDMARAGSYCRAGECGADVPGLDPVRFTSANDFVRDGAPRLRPHFLVLNCGHWAGCGTRAEFNALADSARDAVVKGGGHERNVIWKMTTTSATRGIAGHKHCGPFVARGARVSPDDRVSEGFRVLVGAPGSGVTLGDVFEDTIHFHAEVYAELNNILLNVLAT
ncbi:hypothetical protein JKP88DRAFT_303552 [Tribonema minus]|uniref:Uncharacterized protein n=1 Tax=Tribonema minus TaxID=303371 RepID=A0A836CKK6_9STRA|nr:hypothetical protein JKP88DRAFT_303552 [Tribonema minus]